jgi:hypothetical protein
LFFRPKGGEGCIAQIALKERKKKKKNKKNKRRCKMRMKEWGKEWGMVVSWFKDEDKNEEEIKMSDERLEKEENRFMNLLTQLFDFQLHTVN